MFCTPNNLPKKQAWFMDESEEDPRLPHHRNPKELVSLDHLAGQTSFSLLLLLLSLCL